MRRRSAGAFARTPGGIAPARARPAGEVLRWTRRSSGAARACGRTPLRDAAGHPPRRNADGQTSPRRIRHLSCTRPWQHRMLDTVSVRRERKGIGVRMLFTFAGGSGHLEPLSSSPAPPWPRATSRPSRAGRGWSRRSRPSGSPPSPPGRMSASRRGAARWPRSIWSGRYVPRPRFRSSHRPRAGTGHPRALRFVAPRPPRVRGAGLRRDGRRRAAGAAPGDRAGHRRGLLGPA